MVTRRKFTRMRSRRRLSTQCPIGQSVRDARLRRNLTQEELGEIMGLEQETISSYELGDRTIFSKLEFVRAMAVVVPEVTQILAARYELLLIGKPELKEAVSTLIGRC